MNPTVTQYVEMTEGVARIYLNRAIEHEFGSFRAALANAYVLADSVNKAKLVKEFPHMLGRCERTVDVRLLFSWPCTFDAEALAEVHDVLHPDNIKAILIDAFSGVLDELKLAKVDVT